MIETQEEKGYRGKQCLSFLLYKSRLKKLINVFLVLMKMYKYILWRMKMYKNNKRVFTVSISPLTRALVNRISIINTLAVPSNVGKTYFRGCHIGNKFSLTIFFQTVIKYWTALQSPRSINQFGIFSIWACWQMFIRTQAFQFTNL